MKNNTTSFASKLVPAVGIICFKADQVLMIRRGKPPREGQWSIPGGRVELGEGFEAAALRELMEETGIQAKLCGKIAEIDANFGTHHYTLHDYAAIWIAGEPRAGDDAIEAKFMSLAQVDRLDIWEKTRDVIHMSDAFLRKIK